MKVESEITPSGASAEMNSIAPSFPVNTVVARLLRELERRNLTYCHWKSNIRLEDALAGEDDIDLLFDRREAIAFQAALADCGFRLAVSRFGIDHPGVFHAFALDEETARLVHLHAYSQIVSGDSLVKTYRFPIEAELLDHTRYLHGMRIPTAEAELVLFAIRIALKHASLVELLMVRRNYRLIPQELEWLESQCDIDAAARLCAEWFPGLDDGIFPALLPAIKEEAAVFSRIRLGRRVAWALSGLRRMGVVSAVLNRAKRVGALASARIRRRKDMVLSTGGAIVALVGPKAVGKSTLGSALAGRLGKHLDVRRIHAGKPPATGATFAFRFLVPLARRLFPQARPSEYEKPERRDSKRYSWLYVLRMVVLAYDRRRLLRRALRWATAGAIVISDRYPSNTTGAMDSMQFDAEALANCKSASKRWLMRLERKFCEDVPRPDLVIRLEARLATSISRDATRNKQGGPDADAVERRRTLELDADFASVPVVYIDTERPLDETIGAVMRAAWRGV